MLNYIASKLFKYLKAIIPRKDAPLIEEVPSVQDYRGTSMEFYDSARPTFALNYWVPSSKTFYALDPDNKKFIKISKEVMILEMSLCKPVGEKIVEAEQPFVVTRPLNLYVFDEAKQEFVPYKSKLKISLNF